MKTIWKWLRNEWVLGIVGVLLAARLIFLGRELGLTKSDWASWVQAIGSIMAIVLAFSIAQEQHAHDRRLDEKRRKDERDAEFDAQLLARTVAIQNIVQIGGYALRAASSLVRALQDGDPNMEVKQQKQQIEKLRAVLDSLITPTTENLAVITALELALVLNEVVADTENVGGTRTNDLLTRCEQRVRKGYETLNTLMHLQVQLMAECSKRGIQAVAADFEPG